jgi:hypothetical protein
LNILQVVWMRHVSLKNQSPYIYYLWSSFLAEQWSFWFLFLVVVLGFELRASHLLERCSTTWYPQSVLLSVTIGIGFYNFILIFLDSNPSVYASHGTGMKGICHHTQLMCWDGSLVDFLPGLASYYSPPILHLPNS